MILDAIARALSEAGITIGTYYVVQAYIQCSLLDRNIACSVINKLIVAQLIYIAGKRCIINLQAVIICAGIRSVAVALVGCILSVSFVAYACTVLQAYFIAVDDAVILQAYIAVYLQAILAAVGRAGVDVVQVNLLRIYFRVTCGYFDIVVLGEVCYILCNNAVFSYVPLVLAFVVGLAIVVYKTYIGDCIFVKAYSTFITVDKCVMILDAIARALSEAGITIGAYYVTQANIQRCLFNRRLAICSYYQIIVLTQACICSACAACPLIVTCIVRYPAAAYAINCAVTSFVYCDCACVIAITIYQTGNTAYAITAASNRCITIGTYYVVQAYAQLCFAYIRITIAIHYQIVVLIQACICNFYSTTPGIVAMVIRYPVACYASNCAITINCYLKVTGIIVIAVYQTGDVACAVTATGNLCIAIGAVYVTQANIQLCLAYNRLAIAFHYQIIVLTQSFICSACAACPLILTCIVRYPVAAYASNCAVASNCYLNIAGIIAIAVYQTSDIACAVTAASSRCITIGAYYIVQAYLQGCLFNHRSTIINNQLVVLLKLIVRCNYISIPLISITSIIGYLAAAYAINRAIAINSTQSYIAGSIIIAIDITSQSVNAVACTINQRCITIGALNTVQLNVHFCLINGNAASSVIYKLIVAQLICIAGKCCMINFQAVSICISVRSIAPALISRIAAAILHINDGTISQLDIITINNSICQILNAYHAIDMVINSITATVCQISINIIQVNLARQNLRYAMNCRCCAAFAIIYEFIIACKAIIKFNACLPIVGSLIISTLFIPSSNNTCILAVLDCIL